MASIYRPTLAATDIPPLVQKLYGLYVEVIQELGSYDDQNFHVRVIPSSSLPPTVTSVCAHGYVFKILNSLDSRKPDVIEMQTQIIIHCEKSGYPTPGPVLTLKRQHQELLDLPSSRSHDGGLEKYVVRLFSFIPGKTLDQVVLTRQLCFEVGWYAGKMDVSLKDFPMKDNLTLASMSRKWNLSQIPELKEKLHAITSQDQRRVVEEVINQFEANVLSCQHKFSKGLIHGDFNDCNILVSTEPMFKTTKTTGGCSTAENHVKENTKDDHSVLTPRTTSLKSEGDLSDSEKSYLPSSSTFHVSGVLDFGDTTLSLYMFEVAVAIVYVMINTHGVPPMQAAGQTLAGYLKHMSLSEMELSHLKLCICARCAQSIALAYFTLLQDPDNEHYVMAHAKRVWPVLKTMWETPDSELLKQLMEHVRVS